MHLVLGTFSSPELTADPRGATTVDPAIVAAERALRRGAIAEARRLLAGRGEAPALVLLGVCAWQESGPRDAIAWFRAATERSPDDGMAHGYLALALVSVGMVDAARDALDRALGLAPESFTVRLISAQYAYRLGLYPEAVRRLECALALGASDAASYALARALLQRVRDRGQGSFERRVGTVPLARLVARARQGMGRLSIGSRLRSVLGRLRQEESSCPPCSSTV